MPMATESLSRLGRIATVLMLAGCTTEPLVLPPPHRRDSLEARYVRDHRDCVGYGRQDPDDRLVNGKIKHLDGLTLFRCPGITEPLLLLDGEFDGDRIVDGRR